jgi:hypothetical protein
MKFHLTIIFLLITPFLFAQVNLVPNPSFEVYDTCPNGEGQVNHALGWNINGINNTPDYYNSCSVNFSTPQNWSGYQVPFEGNAYCGFYTSFPLYPPYREYIGTQLVTPLDSGTKYFVSFYVSLANGVNCGTNKTGILFSTIPYYFDAASPTYLNTSQIFTQNIIIDTLNWVKISGSFIADSSYKYISIGNFFDNANTDTTIWLGTNCVAYYYLDNVCVSTDSLTCNVPDAIYENNSKSKTFNIYPNPATNELNIDCALTDKIYFELYDLIGAKRKAVTLDIGSLTKRIDLTDIDSGFYFYSVVDRKGNRIKTGKLVVIK